MPAAPARGGAKSSTAPAPKPADPASLREGVRVRIFGFGVARKELNGKEGSVAGFDEARSRWSVELEDGSGRKLFSQENLEFLEDPYAENRAQAEAEAAARKMAEYAAWQEEERRRREAELEAEKAAAVASAAAQATREMAHASQAALRSGEASDDEVVDLFDGARVCLRGLKANAELNGKYGIIKGFDEGKRRWVVELEDGLGKKLFREANIVAGRHSQPKEDKRDPNAPMGTHRKSFGWNAAQRAATAQQQQPRPEEVEASPSPPKPPPAPPMPALNQQLVPQELVAPDDPLLPPAQPATQEQRDAAFLIEAGPEHPNAGRPLRPGAQVLVGDLQEWEEDRLNGRVGTCELCDYATGKWHVRFGDGSAVALRQDCLSERQPTLRPGAYVQVKDLPSGVAYLNGQTGVCDQMDPASQRWSVHLNGPSGGWKLLKPENLAAKDHNPRARQPEDFELPGARRDLQFTAAMEEALASGEISWLDC